MDLKFVRLTARAFAEMIRHPDAVPMFSPENRCPAIVLPQDEGMVYLPPLNCSVSDMQAMLEASPERVAQEDKTAKA